MLVKKLPESGVGMGLRRSMVRELQQYESPVVDFLEVAPENWMNLGGRLGAQFKWFAERYPIYCHGLSLSVGGSDQLDINFLKSLKKFLDQFNILHYSEHLSFCSADGGHLYDLMPMPFTDEAVVHVARRIQQVQDILERKISIENISYYATLDAQMSELDFINAVLTEANCLLLLDVNNIYVNSINHGYSSVEFLHGLPADKVSYIHVAGHYDEADDLKIDTHGAKVKDPVWSLLEDAYEHVGMKPTLLERDFNIPPLDELLSEVAVIPQIQKKFKQRRKKVA